MSDILISWTICHGLQICLLGKKPMQLVCDTITNGETTQAYSGLRQSLLKAVVQEYNYNSIKEWLSSIKRWLTPL